MNMLEKQIKLFLNEAIHLELNIADLYQLFSVKFPEDHSFWWKLSMEEMGHAAMIETLNDIYFPTTESSNETVQELTLSLDLLNKSIKEKIENYKMKMPMRFEAFQYALELENSAGESHFEKFMTENTDSSMVYIFQKLNGEDINHAIRLGKYMEEKL